MRAFPVACCLATACLMLAPAAVRAESTDAPAGWPQWRGPGRNGISSEKGGEWVLPPALLWQCDIDAKGHGGLAVAGGRVYTAGQPERAELTVLCLDAGTGREVWRHRSDTKSSVNATPTLDRGCVYIYSTRGRLLALDAGTGKQRWSTDPLSNRRYSGSP